MDVARSEPIAVSAVPRFDHETDVIVVGFGAAGAAAAIEARAAGAEVTVLEGLSGPGGSSGQSGGELYLGGGTETQRACGHEDTPEAMRAFLSSALGPHVDEDKLALYCGESVEHHDWFVGLGLKFQPTVYDAPGWLPPTTDGLMWLGERAWPHAEHAAPTPRGHRPAAPYFAGGALMEVLSRGVDAGGAQVDLDTRAQSLIVDGVRVVGVRARRFGETLHYAARRGVVLTTGGFVDNEEMLAEHAPVLVGHGKVSDGGDDGGGIVMAAAMGAALRRMGSVEVSMTIVPGLACRGILVNGRGQRFMNEDVYPGLYSHEALLHQPGPFWVVIDLVGFENTPASELHGLQPQFAAESLEELERELELPQGELQHTVARYNESAIAGVDVDFHKAPTWLRPLEGPFAAFDPRVLGASSANPTGFAGFTLGGIRTTVDGEVIHVSGRVIPGLYAAGRAAAGMHGDGYISGTSLGDSTFFGRRAGRHAAGGAMAVH